ncbi:50S ribosomal protein L32 [Polynucleobacter sp.]|uniref:50S ribosomal protein L32 n=1 Tax=Polynucleobacter sp. TaxID=2029855 RepID=UPI00258411F8|nr:50S ribosomal protein L32 [Polynucleobacter sp.]MCX7237414.1 50S ribosomal protein L32 [Polynucleobacter sp.]
MSNERENPFNISHDFLTAPATAVEATTGEAHLRHHISPNGYYRGRKVVKTKND